MEKKEKYIHRDLSWLAFNQRVMNEALDHNNPLLEKIRFLAIFVNNLDEFFMVRLARHKQLVDAKRNRLDAFGLLPQEIYQALKTNITLQIKQLYKIYEENIKPELKKNKIELKQYHQLNEEQKKFAKKYFETTIYPIITPMAVDQGHPFPVLHSKTIAYGLTLTRKDQLHFAILPIPTSIGRLVKLPDSKDEMSFILIDEIIKENLKTFFRGFDLTDSTLFRVIRDSELLVDEEYSPDLLNSIENELKRRARAKTVHLEMQQSCSQELLTHLCRSLEFAPEQVTQIKGDLDLTFLFELIAQAPKPDLLYPNFATHKPDYENIFDRIKESDFLLHVPYQSFQPVVDFIQTAAQDSNVLAIKMTLYRTNQASAIIKALKEAAKNKKQVTVLVEIKARFDEEANINWVRELEEAGCHVIYGIAGMKIHSKIAFVVRREEGRIRRYVHLSTGNYNEKTARVYTDLGYFTANEDFARDISDVFNVITGYSLPSRWKRIISSPYDLRNYFFDLIDREIEFQEKYQTGFIFAKMNSLEDPKMIDKLYEASQKGVKIQLIVRGICCLIPGLKGLSENITAKSIVGRFLEHTRIFIFHNNGNFRPFLSSADWMRRNLDRRIELLFEISKEELKQQLKQILENYWADKAKSHYLNEQGIYNKIDVPQNQGNIQEQLICHYSN